MNIHEYFKIISVYTTLILNFHLSKSRNLIVALNNRTKN